MELLNKEQLDLLGVQQVTIDECVRGVLYYRTIQGLNPMPAHWRFIKGVLLRHAIIQWCQIFGSKGEQIHWSKLAEGQAVVEPFDRAAILAATKLPEEQWLKYHKDITELRNKFLAHFDMDSLKGHIPHLDPALASILAYRNWIVRLLQVANEKGHLLRIAFPYTPELLKGIESEFTSAMCSSPANAV